MLAKFSGQFSNLLIHWRRSYTTTPIARTPVFLASIGVTVLLLLLRQIGILQPLELGAYDEFLRSRPQEKTDPRILVVGVTEQDIQQLNQWPLSDGKMAKLLEKLERYKPRVIGLDIYRTFPVPPGHSELVSQMGKSDRLIAICKLSDADNQGIAPPKTIPPKRVGFSDLVIDDDGVIRRALLFARQNEGKCTTRQSFSFQLANRYLAIEGIESYRANPAGDMGFKRVKQPSTKGKKTSPKDPLVIFPRLVRDAGGYQKADTRGYQILLNYRSAGKVARQVTLTEVLTDRVRPEWVRDRVVLIGVVAASIDDAFYTPYSAAQTSQHKMPGVVVHAQIVSQILSAALDGRSLLWYWPAWIEWLWTWGWAILGGALGWKLRHPLRLALSELAALGVLGGVCYGLWIYSGWVPLVPPALALVTSGGSVVVIVAYQMYQERQRMAALAQEEEETIVAIMTTKLKGNTTTALPESEATSIDLPEVSCASYNFAPQLFGGRYQIDKILGQGGFGRTYLAKDMQRPGEPICVVKHLMPARRDERFLEIARRLFETEAKILEVLGRHDQIPQLLAYIEQNQEFFLVEQYVEGTPLSDELPAERRWSQIQVVELLEDLLPILDFIHQHHVIHRDIKPANIIRRKQDGRLVLIDFGAVKQMLPPEGDVTESQTVAIGTRGYAPPEQMAGHPRLGSDLYALGIIGIQALTGIQPHLLSQESETGNIIWQPLAHVGEELGKILDGMIQYHFHDRYKSAAEVLRQLKQLDRTKLHQVAPKPDLIDMPPTEIIPAEPIIPYPSKSWNYTTYLDTAQPPTSEPEQDNEETSLEHETHKT